MRALFWLLIERVRRMGAVHWVYFKVTYSRVLTTKRNRVVYNESDPEDCGSIVPEAVLTTITEYHAIQCGYESPQKARFKIDNHASGRCGIGWTASVLPITSTQYEDQSEGNCNVWP